MTAMFKGTPETDLPADDALTTTAGSAVMMTLTCNVPPRCWCCSACVERKAKASQQGQGDSGCHGNDIASLPHSNWDGNGKRLRRQWFENNVMEGGGRRRRVRWEMDVRHGRLDECGDSDEDEVGRDAFQRVCCFMWHQCLVLFILYDRAAVMWVGSSMQCVGNRL